jgi:hypothetical protein
MIPRRSPCRRFAVGAKCYPGVRCVTITADGGGSNGSRVRLWKLELQKLADELGIEIAVHHYPPGTSKWNKIEHRLFSFISMNCRARNGRAIGFRFDRR